MGKLKRYYHDALSEEESDELPPEATPAELAVILEADTDDVQRALMLLDGTEAYTDAEHADAELLLTEVAVESFSDSLLALWSQIRRWLSATARVLTDLTSVGYTSAKLLAYQSENLKMEIRMVFNRKSGNLPPTLLVRSHVLALSVFYKTPKTIGDVAAGLRNLEHTLTAHYNYADHTLMSGVRKLTSTIRRLDPGSFGFETDVEALTAQLHALSPMTVLKAQYTIDAGNEFLGTHLLGNQRLAGRPIPRNPTLTDVLQSRVYLRHSESTPKPTPNAFTIPRFGLMSSDQTLSEVTKVAKLITATLAPSKVADRRRALNDLSSAVDQLVLKSRQLENAPTATRHALESITQIPKSVTRWVNAPIHGMTSNALRSLRGVLMVCRQNVLKED